MAVEHTFFGTWEISECCLNKEPEIIGLEGVKFRLDEMGDITWFNDLLNSIPLTDVAAGNCSNNYINNESAEALFSCETFEILDLLSNGPGLIFGAFAGYSIEFKTDTFAPENTMKLSCDGWYTLHCKRIIEEQSIGLQQAPFTLISAYTERYFNDGIISSSEGIQFYLHSAILRLNGFDCTENFLPIITTATSTTTSFNSVISELKSNLQPLSQLTTLTTKAKSQIKISIIEPPPNNQENQHLSSSDNRNKKPSSSSSSSYLLSPNLHLSPTLDIFQYPSKLANNLSNSFNCLTSTSTAAASLTSGNGGLRDNYDGQTISSDYDDKILKKYLMSSSDSNLPATKLNTKNIFNFGDFFVNAGEQTNIPTSLNEVKPRGRPPLSPYRSKSPSFSMSIETPPSSPLTPVAILQTLPTQILTPIFQWMYSESLPDNLDEECCERLINFAESIVPLNKMVEPCRKYLKLIQLKKFVIKIVMDVHNSLDRIIHLINPRTLRKTPVILYTIFKQALREAAVGCAKILQFCNIFVKDAHDISRYQRHEIIKYIKDRIPIFLTQCHQLLQNISSILSSLREDDKNELVSFLVPEIKISLDLITDVAIEIKASLETVCKDLRNHTYKKRSQQQQQQHHQEQEQQQQNQQTYHHQQQPIDVVDEFNNYDLNTSTNILTPDFSNNTEHSLKFVLYIYEVKRMKDIYGRVTSALEFIQQKRSAFNELTISDKHLTTRRNLDEFIKDIPKYISMVENISKSLEEKVLWKEFKFCFKLATSQINGVVRKLLDHKSALKDAITHICQLIFRTQFTRSMIDLGLLDPSNAFDDQEDDLNELNLVHDYNKTMFNFIKHLCEPPSAAQSALSKNALRLLHSGQLADMEFQVNAAPTIQTDKYKTSVNEFQQQYSCHNQIHIFKAHRVIVASRCEWFKKALLSGMQESINRKIIISDTSPVIFRRLLLYLYGAPIDKTVGIEHITELMLLADKYSIDELKDICECTLTTLIDEEWVIYLLGISDRYNTMTLKASCLSFLSQHLHLIKSDIFQEFPQNLQLEVQELIQWCGRTETWNQKSSRNIHLPNHHYHHPHHHHHHHHNHHHHHHHNNGTSSSPLSYHSSLKSPSRTSHKSSRSRKSSPSFM